MLRAIRRIVLLLLVAAVAGGTLVALTTKPKLDAADRRVTRSWSALHPALATRFERLRDLDAAMTATGRTVEIAAELDATLAKWARRDGSVEAQVVDANHLESLGTRLVATAAASPRFSASSTVATAANRYQQTVPSGDAVQRFNAEVDRLNALRDGLLRRIVADALGHRDHPHYMG